MAEDFHVWYRYHILMSGEIKMKRIILPIFIFTFCLSSCNFLERLPKDKIDPNDFFRTEEDLKLFSNSFYDNLFEKQPFKQQSDVFVQKGTLSDELLGGDARMPIPVTGGGWSWGQLRKINTMLGNMHKCEDPKVARQYSGLAKFLGRSSILRKWHVLVMFHGMIVNLIRRILNFTSHVTPESS